MKPIALAALLALSAGPAGAAIVHLKEGGRLEGALVSSDSSEVVLDTAQGRVRVEMSRVASIDPQAASAPPPRAPQEFRSEPRGGFFRRADEPFEPGRQMFSVDFGVVAPMSRIGLSGSAGGGSAPNGGGGPGFGFQYLYFPSARVGLGLEFHSYGRSSWESRDLFPSADARVFGDSLLFLGVLKASLTDHGPARPYLLLGAGGHLTSTVVDARPLPGYAWTDTGTGEPRRLIDGGAGGLAASARLGLDFFFADPSIFSLEAGWTGLASANYQATAQGAAQGVTGARAPVHYFTLTGRWGFSF